MSAGNNKFNDYNSLSPSAGRNAEADGFSGVRLPKSGKNIEDDNDRDSFSLDKSGTFRSGAPVNETPTAESQLPPRISLPQNEPKVLQAEKTLPNAPDLSYGDEQRKRKNEARDKKDTKLLTKDRWLARNGHSLTFVGIFLFTFVLYFRPYEWLPGGSVLSSAALYLAVATLLIYLPTQLATESSLTVMTVEVKAVSLMAIVALGSIIIARNREVAWEKLNDPFIKVVLIFIVMVNVIRTKERLMKIIWLGIGVGVMVSYEAVINYMNGKFAVEGYRVGSDMKGMFGNPNDLAIHLVMYVPIAIAFGAGAKKLFTKLLYFAFAALFIGGAAVTQSRGAFLAIIAMSLILTWKLGRENRLKYALLTLAAGIVFIAAAPGNYGVRILSIFVPALDPVGSASERSELLKHSLWVTLRNPWGVGIGNFPVVSPNNMETHNAYTQVSSELGLLGLAIYLVILIAPLKRLNAMERRLFASQDKSWMYYLSIGLQAGIGAYMVASFFGPVAYQWYIYYPIAYAVALRRIYALSKREESEKAETQLTETARYGLQTG